MKEYRIQFLDDKKFETLSLVNPRYVNTKDDLGFADMLTDRIFVRRTGISFVDQFTTAHEIEEILAKNSAHTDEWNIRHKKGRDVIRWVAPILGAVLGGPAGAALGAKVGIGTTMASAIGGAVGGAGGSAISQAGTGQPVKTLPTLLAGAGGALGGASMAPGITASKEATTLLGRAPSYAGQVLTGAQQALGFQSGAQKTLAAAATPLTPTQTLMGLPAPTTPPIQARNIASMKGLMQATQIPGFIPGIGMQAPQAAQAAGLGFQPPVAGATPAQAQTLGTTTPAVPKVGPEAALPTGAGTAGTGVGAGAGAGAGQVATKTPMLEKFLGANWRQTLLGASIPLIGQSMMGQQMFPPGSENVPFTPEQSQLFQETADMVRQGAQVQLTPAQQQTITVNYDDALEQARQNIMDRYKMLRPGSDIATDSNLREALIELESDFAEKKANAVAGAQLGLSTQQTQMMAELANMQIGTLALKAGISYQESRDFKNMLQGMGFLVAQAGQPIYVR